MQNHVSILGCGWLGLPLAKHLVKKGWQVKGSTTSKEKMKTLEAESIKAYKIELQEHGVSGDINGFLEDSELLIINVPPGLRRDPNSNFVAKLKALTEVISEKAIKNILYVSSTGVFSDHDSFPLFTEHYEFSPSELKSSQLIQAEHLLRNLIQVQTSVIRFSGLVGKERHPVKFLSGKTGIKNPEAPVNLIHLDNCVLLISEIIQQKKFGYVFHGNEDIQLSKEDYYTNKAKRLNLPTPKFDYKTTSVGKEISMKMTAWKLGISISRKV